MKKITAFLGFMGVVSMISGCTDAGSDVIGADLNEHAVVEPTSSVAAAATSSASKGNAENSVASSATSTASSAASGEADTVTQLVYITASSNYTAPYYSSNSPFCWSGNCEGVVPASASSSSSSYNLEVTISSEAPVYPTVTENQMIDQRDQKAYKLQTIAGVHWMAENLNHETSSGSYCPTKDGADMCAKHGTYYIYSAAQKACPTGWRLPTQAEVEALDAAVEHSWWDIGGRVNVEEGENFGNEGDQGYIWFEDNGTNNSFRIKNYNNDSPHEVQSVGGNTRAYNVRCVENK